MTPGRLMRRRQILAAAAGGFAVALVPRMARADRVFVPQQLPMSLADLLAISDDETAVMDALTYMLWRAPSMAGMVAQVSIPPIQRTYKTGFDGSGPQGFEVDAGVLGAWNDRLAVLFACDIVADAGGEFQAPSTRKPWRML
jgi:hypothetical protein